MRRTNSTLKAGSACLNFGRKCAALLVSLGDDARSSTVAVEFVKGAMAETPDLGGDSAD
jgi:hypothetical protein